MGWLKAIFAFAGGPMAWLAALWDFVLGVLTWCVKNWRITLPILALLAAGYGGMRWERSGWVKKWTARDKEDQRLEEQRGRTILELQLDYNDIEAKAQADKEARDKEYAALEKRMKDYVARNHGSGAGIGDDGLQLIVDAIRARRRPH